MNEPDRRTERFRARRDEIVDIAAALFAKRSYALTGVAEISEAAGLGKGGLYYYIDSKEALLVEIHERVMEPLVVETARLAALEASAPVRLRLVSEALLGAIVDQRDHVSVFLQEHRTLTGELLEKLRTRRRAYERLVTGIIEDGVAEGAFVVDDLRLTVLAFIGMHNYTYQWVRPDGRLRPAEISERYCRLVLDGMGAPGTTWDDVRGEVDRWRAIAAGRPAPAGAGAGERG